MIITSVAVGVFAMLLSMGILNGIMTQMVDNTINTSLGHVSIRRAGPMESIKLKHSFTPEPNLYDVLEKNRETIKGWAPRLKTKGMVRSSTSSQAVQVVGIDTVKEQKVSYLREYTRDAEGSRFLEENSSNAVLISGDMAGKLDLIPGDRMVLMMQDTGDELVATALIVQGIFQTPVDAFDRYNIFVGIDHLRSLTASTENTISEISITLPDRDDATRARDTLRSALPGTTTGIYAWTDMAPRLVQSITIVDTMMYVSFGIIFITIIFSIANTLIMAIMERFYEIGVLKSIGTSPRLIFSMILFESITLCLLGLAAGTVAGIIINGSLGFIGIDLGVYSKTLRAMGSGSTIIPSLRIFDILISSMIVLLTAFFAALIPARKAARIDPVEALTHL